MPLSLCDKLFESESCSLCFVLERGQLPLGPTQNPPLIKVHNFFGFLSFFLSFFCFWFFLIISFICQNKKYRKKNYFISIFNDKICKIKIRIKKKRFKLNRRNIKEKRKKKKEKRKKKKKNVALKGQRAEIIYMIIC